jgi:hypothetical protein
MISSASGDKQPECSPYSPLLLEVAIWYLRFSLFNIKRKSQKEAIRAYLFSSFLPEIQKELSAGRVVILQSWEWNWGWKVGDRKTKSDAPMATTPALVCFEDIGKAKMFFLVFSKQLFWHQIPQWMPASCPVISVVSPSRYPLQNYFLFLCPMF